MAIQAQVPPGLAALHNFIMDTDPYDIDHYLSRNLEVDLDLIQVWLQKTSLDN